MRTIYLAILCLIAHVAQGQPFTQSINFNTYVSTANNELVNNFGGGYLLTQSTTNGITGGCVNIPATNGPAAVYHRVLKLSTDTTTVTLCFKFDSLAFAAGPHNDDAISLTFRTPSSSADSIKFGVWGDRINIYVPTGSYGGTFPRLSHNHWFQLNAQIVITPSGQITALSRLYDLDLSGTATPIMVKERYGFMPNIFAQGDSAILTMNAKKAFGAVYLDNFNLNARAPQLSVRKSSEQLEERIVVPTLIQGNLLKVSSSLGKLVTFHVYSMDGRLAKRGSFTDQALVDCADLPAGNYTISLFAEGGSVSKRLIKY